MHHNENQFPQGGDAPTPNFQNEICLEAYQLVFEYDQQSFEDELFNLMEAAISSELYDATPPRQTALVLYKVLLKVGKVLFKHEKALKEHYRNSEAA